MSAAKTFLDANVFVYAQDADVAAKRRRSRALIEELATAGTGVTSTQVMQEFYVAATRKLNVAPLAAKSILKTFRAFEIVQVSPELVDDAIDCSILNGLSFWDALIVSAASSSGCGRLLSEDMNHGQVILGVRIENPFGP